MSIRPPPVNDLLLSNPTAVYRCVFEASPNHVSISWLADGTYIDVNPGFQRFTGFSREEVVGRTSLEVGIWREASDRAAFVDEVRRYGGCTAFASQMRVRGGEMRDVEIAAAVSVLCGEPILISVVTDVSERKRVAAELAQHRLHLEQAVAERTEALRRAHAELADAHARLLVREQQSTFSAQHDSLTGLPNRSLLNTRLAQALADAAQHGGEVAALFIDLDDFKRINDGHGHAVGDAALCKLAERLRACVRHGDMVARLGGDEFVVLICEPHGAVAAAAIAQKMIGCVQEPIQLADRCVQTSISVGIAICPADGTSAHQLLRNADAAMYRAKLGGKGRLAFYSPPASGA